MPGANAVSDAPATNVQMTKYKQNDNTNTRR